jgi:hypothetical protein
MFHSGSILITLPVFQIIFKFSIVNADILIDAGFTDFFVSCCQTVSIPDVQSICIEFMLSIPHHIFADIMKGDGIAEWIALMIDEGPIDIKSHALIVHLRSLQLFISQSNQYAGLCVNHHLMRSRLDLLLCGNNDETIDLAMTFHSIALADDWMRRMLIESGLIEVLSELRECQRTELTFRIVDELITSLSHSD